MQRSPEQVPLIIAAGALALGGTLPDIVVDGVDRWGDEAPMDLNLQIEEDESVTFVDLGLGSYPIDPSKLSPSTERPEAGLPLKELSAVKLSHAE